MMQSTMMLGHEMVDLNPDANDEDNFLNPEPDSLQAPLHRSIGNSMRNLVGKAFKSRKTRNFSRAESLKHLDPTDGFYSIFNIDKATRRLTILQELSNYENKGIDFDTLPPMDDKQTIKFTWNEMVGRVIQSKLFRYTIMTLIFTNFILIAVETNKSLEREYHAFFETVDQFITTVFICEVLLKWFHGFRKFWYNGFNILDFFIVFSLLIGPLVLSSSSNKIIRILRVLRVFRSLREINSIPRLQVIVQAILQSVPDMANIVVLLVIFMLVFSVLGITLFGEDIASFADLSTTMFSLFICITQDGWVEILKEFKDTGYGLTYIGGSLYLIIFIVMGAFIFINLIVAVVVTNLEYAVKDVKNEDTQSKAKELEKLRLENEQYDQEIKIDQGEDIPSRIFEDQEALLIPDLSGLDIRCIENYFLIIAAIEENLIAYQKLAKDLQAILNEACELNKSAEEESSSAQNESNTSIQGYGSNHSSVIGQGIGNEKRRSIASVQSAISMNQSISNRWRRRTKDQGDMLSSLMKMEDSKGMTDSSRKNSIKSVVSEIAKDDKDIRQRFLRRRSSLRRNTLIIEETEEEEGGVEDT